MKIFHFGKVFGVENFPSEGAVLVVSNHQSFFDPVLVGYGLDRELDYMARDTLFKNKLFVKLIKSLNAFPVKRGEIDIGAVKETLRRLKNGRAVLLFPEATRTADGKIREFKPGIAMLAKKAKVPVVPAVIEGAFDAWPRTRKLPRPFVPIYVMFSEPIYPEDYERISPEEFVGRIYNKMVEMQGELKRKMGKAK